MKEQQVKLNKEGGHMNKQEKNTTLPFIKTSDRETMEILQMEGFDLVDYSNGIWTFINCMNKQKKQTKLNFETDKKITFSKVFCI